MRTLQLTLATLLLAAATAGGQAEDQIELKYVQLKPGEVQYMHMVQDTVGTMEGMGPVAQTMAQKFETWMRMDCLGVDADGVATIRLTYDRVAMSMNMGPIKMAFDSAKKDDPEAANNPIVAPFAGALSAMAGLSFEARIDPQGKCLEVKGVSEAIEAMTKDMPGGEQMAELFASFMSEESMKDNWAGAIWKTPNSKVRIGEVWSDERRMPLGPMGEQVIKIKYKLLGTEVYKGRSCAKIGGTLAMGMGTPPEGMKVPGGGQMKMQMTAQDGKSLILWDYARGRMMSSKMSLPVEIVMEMANPKLEQPMKMTQKMTISLSAETLDGPPPVPTSQPVAATIQ